MAGKGNGGGREMVLESRHLVGLFLLMVVISGIVFTLGYILGRNQYESQVRAEGLVPKEEARGTTESAPASKSGSGVAKSGSGAANSAPAPSDWDFYKSAEAKKPANRLEKPARLGAPAPVGALAAKGKPAAHPSANVQPPSAKTKALLSPPLIPKGAIVLQVAAMTQENDALAIAEALQKKKFPAFVLTPSSDRYYRVQVGPYADARSAKAAQKGLDQAGFKAIVKR